MAPATSRPSPIDRLIDDLRSADTLRRDAAVARLRVLGARAFPRLAAFIAKKGPSGARALALAALEGTEEPHAVDVALACLDSDVEVAVAALGVLRTWVTAEAGTRVLEAVAAVAVDAARDSRVRRAAVDALADLPDDLVGPIREQAPPPESAGPVLSDPVAALEWIEAHGAKATLSTLDDAVKAFRDRAAATRSRRERAEWIRARGAVHAALARRGSRLALYDAKETIIGADASVPAGFLDGMKAVGDASCLEPLARAWSAAPRGSEWRSQLAETARHIVGRLKLSGRSAIVKSIRARWEGFI